MKIAVTYENGNIYQHFGHTEQFKLYQVENGKVTDSQVVSTNGSGHSALVDFLQAHGVEAVICGGVGGCAREGMEQAGIALYGGASGNADAAVQALIQGALSYDPNAKCEHHGAHEHGAGHQCGGHH